MKALKDLRSTKRINKQIIESCKTSYIAWKRCANLVKWARERRVFRDELSRKTLIPLGTLKEMLSGRKPMSEATAEKIRYGLSKGEANLILNVNVNGFSVLVRMDPEVYK